MKFWKYHGLGNDFVLSEDLDGTLEATPQRAARLLNRHTGIGGDGWLLVRRSEVCDIAMFLYNTDGSVAEMCGNGLRCFAKHVYDHGIVKKEVFTVETLAGVMEVTIAAEDGVTKTVTANLGAASFDRASIPMTGEGECDRITMHALDRDFTVSACLMGVPHAVVFGTDFTDVDVMKYGPVLETDPVFPRKANINFANILDDHTVEVRTWERGCGRTLACGTGSSATAVLCHRAGYTGADVEIRLQEGSLRIQVTGQGVVMTGPAALAFTGETAL